MERELVDVLAIRRRLGRETWGVPYAYGADSWVFDHKHVRSRIIVSCSHLYEEGVMWVHASMSRPPQMPTYEDLKMLHEAVFVDGWSYQVFAPAEHHININEFVLHLWGRLDGKAVMPNFGVHGSI